MFFPEIMSRVDGRLFLVVVIAVPLVAGLAILAALIKDIAGPRTGRDNYLQAPHPGEEGVFFSVSCRLTGEDEEGPGDAQDF